MLNNIITDLAYVDLINEVRGYTVLLHKPYGNIGDALLIEATKQMFSRHFVKYYECDPKNYAQILNEHSDINMIVYGPGGNVSGRYNTGETVTQLFALAKRKKIRYVCFPQSVENWTPELLLFDKIYVRDKTSLKIASFAGACASLCPDIGLNFRIRFLIPSFTEDHGFFPRQDAEKLEWRKEYNDPTEGVGTVKEYILKAAKYRRITTDRLHFAIAGILVGRDVTLVRNDYHKNESIWNSYLHMFCKFQRNL
jgi:exopolysaccharide biosynthesis predicted pyruvyltransferase EpsI